LKDNHNKDSGLNKNVEEGQAIRLKKKINMLAMGSRFKTLSPFLRLFFWREFFWREFFWREFFWRDFLFENYFGQYFFWWNFFQKKFSQKKILAKIGLLWGQDSK